MFGRYLVPFALLLSACATASTPQDPDPAYAAWATQCEDWDEWDKPGPPFRIHGNSYYVGTCGIGAILITNSDGHFLIDSGTEAGADVVLENIRALGFNSADISLLLTSHEHYDHVGGMAKLQAITGADVLTSDAARSVLETGIASSPDPQFGMHGPMAPVPVVGTFGIGNHYGYILDRLGLEMIATPGHTPGALSWQWESCDDAGECLTIVYADSMSPVSSDTYRFSDHPEYVQAYRESIARVAALECDILLTPHPSASDMRDKLLGDGLASGTNCRDYAASITERLDARLAEEAAQ
jgi:metallo-beta-lactamase class B